jgi:hypothetical protein
MTPEDPAAWCDQIPTPAENQLRFLVGTTFVPNAALMRSQTIGGGLGPFDALEDLHSS